jgi:transcriptional regulator with XRE-family HTH domain
MTPGGREGTNQHVQTVAERFKALREHLGWNQDDFEGVHRTEVNKIEGGGNQLTGGDLRDRVARSLGVSIEDLVAYVSGKMPLAQLAAKRAKKPTLVPASAAKWVTVDAETRRKATVYLKQPPQAFSDEAIALAFEELRIADPEVAKSPRRVADAVRVVILGIIASMPSEAPLAGTRRSK